MPPPAKSTVKLLAPMSPTQTPGGAPSAAVTITHVGVNAETVRNSRPRRDKRG